MKTTVSRISQFVVVVATVFLFGVATAPAAVFYVDVKWTGTGSGTASDPFVTLGDAVAATGGSGTHQIRVAAGEYTSTLNGGLENFGTTGYNLTGTNSQFFGGYGGYDGVGSFDWSTRTLPVAGSLNTSTMTVIDLTHANSRAFVSTDYTGHGTIDGMAFRNSTVSQTNYHGGAINLGGSGYGTVRVRDSVFENNQTTGMGGGAYINTRSYDTPSVIDTVFVGNTANYGGGLAIRPGNGWTTVQNLIFDNNTSILHGGGMYVTSGVVNVYDSEFVGNTAGGYGGAVSTARTVNIFNSRLIGNQATNGAAVGQSQHENLSISLQNSLVADNTATAAGGYVIYAKVSHNTKQLKMYHVTLADNNADNGVYAYGGTGGTMNLEMLNSILVGQGGGIGIASDNPNATLEYNDVWNFSTLYGGSASPGTGSWSVDPVFADSYQLLTSSPLIGQGMDLGIGTDLLGDARSATPTIGTFENPIPEPTSLVLFGVSALAFMRRRRREK